jgi:tetratricopeptide (TPR) repeat protein
LRELLYQPYGQMDIHAAAALALCGDLEAPSLIAEGLSEKEDRGWFLAPCVAAAAKIVGRPLELPRIRWEVRRTSTADGWFENGNQRTSDSDKVAPLLEALQESIAALPDTEFERRRKEYLGSDRRRREMALRTFDAIAAAEDFDLAAASTWLTTDSEEEVGSALERFDRLCALCERRLAGARGIEAQIAALNDLLASVGPTADTHASHLPRLLAEDNGNCLARTTLYLSVAQRLGLPVVAYDLPGHVYAAWKADGRRRNIETTDAGRERPDGGRAMSRRQVLSVHLSNKAAALLEEREAFAAAVEMADRALALDPTNPNGYVVRAQAVWHADLETDPRPDFDRAEELEPGQAWRWGRSSEIALELGFSADAVRRAEKAMALEASPRAIVALARACRASRNETRAQEVADEAAKRWPDADVVKRMLFEMSLDREGFAPLDRKDIPGLWKARALLDRASPARALRHLDEVREETLKGVHVPVDAVGIDVPPNKQRCREFRLLEAQALAKLGRIDEAREALRAAEEVLPANRETLVVRKLLGDE